MDTMRLHDRVAIVTGAGTGIGRAIAQAFAREGATVVVDYVVRPDAAEQVVHEIERAGGKALAIQANVTKREDVRRLVQEAVKRFGRLDIMVNNAGVETKYAFLDLPQDEWDHQLAVDLTGPFMGAQEAAKAMVERGIHGHIINISSVHEDLPMPQNAAYCAAKGGLRMLMRTIADELAGHQITVNNIAPGAIDTPMDAELKKHPDQVRALLSEIPLGRMGQPEEVGELAVYLASDAAAYCTGSTYVIDGGLMRHAQSL